MCTLTYIPGENEVIFTSNRDEISSRKTLAPQIYTNGYKKLLYPKDELAGGTWIACNNNGRLLCLLNGAFKHGKKPDKYRKSRGLILLEAFEYENIIDFWKSIDLTGIESFTLVYYENKEEKNFYEFKWDEHEKYTVPLPIELPRIWSSASLYDSKEKIEREKLFEDFIASKIQNPAKAIFDFHQNPKIKRKSIRVSENPLIELQTVSTSQFVFNPSQVELTYRDWVEGKSTQVVLGF